MTTLPSADIRAAYYAGLSVRKLARRYGVKRKDIEACLARGGSLLRLSKDEHAIKRGRPVGSGIDDAERLQELAKLIRSNPDLRPTTALRALGFDNPSEIRRLRDKFKRAA